MRIPELDLECDVLECVRVVDRELEIVSQTFLKEIEKKIGIRIRSTYLLIANECLTGLLIEPKSMLTEDDEIFLSCEITDTEYILLSQMFNAGAAQGNTRIS